MNNGILKTSCRHMQISRFPEVKPGFPPFRCSLNQREYLQIILNSWSRVSPQRDFVLPPPHRTRGETLCKMGFSLSPVNATHFVFLARLLVHCAQTLPICEWQQSKERAPPPRQQICGVCRDAGRQLVPPSSICGNDGTWPLPKMMRLN